MRSTSWFLVFATLFVRCMGFQVTSTSRRDVLQFLGGGLTASALGPSVAVASGGATAGGVYLLSAKQRYNERVTEGVRAFKSLRTNLENKELDPIRNFFQSEETGGFKDFSAAGYLLANAFRRNSTTPPDSLPSVQKWKAFAESTKGISKALKSKDFAGAMAAYDTSIVKLDEYLSKVELPSTVEI